MLTFKEVLSLKTDILHKYRVKYVRHKDTREEYREIIKNRSALLEYQAQQHNEVFHNCDYIASFIGLEQSRAVFIGLFKVNGVEIVEAGYQYDLIEVTDDEIVELKERLVIDWGSSAQSWHQWIDKNPKAVTELLPKGYIGNFPGMLNFTLEFNELKYLVANSEANRDWYTHLSSAKGIYLILDKQTGAQYVGAAYGEKGIWQRWHNYALTGDGGNEGLKELCAQNREYSQNFQFSILQSLPINTSDKEVRAAESLYKQKLGSKVFGLNKN